MLPGATAFVPALVNSGLPNDKFILKALPEKKDVKRDTLNLPRNNKNDFFMFHHNSKKH
jgi:16S rRNA (cytidine1402-2'-O)-methyltransferase